MKVQSALVINDIHIPFSCKRAVELTMKVGELLKPDKIFMDGDILDCWEISTFVKHPLRRHKNNLRDEIAEGRRFIYDMRRRFPDADIYWIFGNHEYRWTKFLAQNASELAGLQGLTLAEQLHCAQNKIKVIDSGNRESSFQWGKLLIGHFDQVNKHSAYTAKNLVETKGVSLIQAHVHRGGAYFKRGWDRDLVGYENFCLCDRNPDYVDRPNWQLGFCIVYKDTNSDFFYVQQHPIVEIETAAGRKTYRTMFNGEVIQG